MKQLRDETEVKDESTSTSWTFLTDIRLRIA
jgi:hypothetical protein